MKEEIYWYEINYRPIGTDGWITYLRTLDNKEEVKRSLEMLKKRYPYNEYRIIKNIQIAEEINEEDI